VELFVPPAFVRSARENSILENDGDELIHLSSGNGKFRFQFDVIRFITARRPDVLHFVLVEKKLLMVYLFLFLFRRLLGVKVYTTIADYAQAVTLIGTPFTKLVRACNRLCTDVREFVYPSHVLKGDDIVVDPCSFTDYELFRPDEKKQDKVVFSGRLIALKNPLLFLEAVNILQKTSADGLGGWKFYLRGDGEEKEALTAYVRAHRLEAYVEIGAGEMSPLLNASKIFCSIQHFGNYPSQALLEAMGAGNAIIATDVGNTRMLLDENCSILIDEDPQQLADAITLLMKDDGRRAALGRIAREKVMQEHSLERFAEFCADIWRGMQ
jgi:glycosyltransferase involved in cell wall biosynthesis